MHTHIHIQILHKVFAVAFTLNDLSFVPALYKVPIYHDGLLDLLLVPAYCVALCSKARPRLALAKGVHETRDREVVVDSGKRNLQGMQARLLYWVLLLRRKGSRPKVDDVRNPGALPPVLPARQERQGLLRRPGRDTDHLRAGDACGLVLPGPYHTGARGERRQPCHRNVA